MLLVVQSEGAGEVAAELIALAKSKPGTLNFASAGQGSITHMACELFATWRESR